MAANRILWALSKKTAVQHTFSTRNPSKASDGSGSSPSAWQLGYDSENLGKLRPAGPSHGRPIVTGGLPDLEVGEPVAVEGLGAHCTACFDGAGRQCCAAVF